MALVGRPVGERVGFFPGAIGCGHDAAVLGVEEHPCQIVRYGPIYSGGAAVPAANFLA